MTEQAPPAAQSLAALARAFHTIGWLSFGGPAGQIALMHRDLVEQRGWVGEEDFLHGLNLCHLLPGPEAQQLSIWIGWRLHGWRGGLVAGTLFVVPGALVMLGLSLAYALAAGAAWFAGLFLGVKAAVLALVVQALWRIGGRALGDAFRRIVALGAFAALALGHWPFPLVIGLAGLAGALRPGTAGASAAPGSTASLGGTLRSAGLWLGEWLAPLALLGVTLGRSHVLWQIGWFFAKLAVVSFGGAYAALGYMAQAAVQQFHWLSPAEMANGLGLAETTPGPLILVTQFVGFTAAWRMPAPFTPLVAGVLGALLTCWMTFAPCFLWIFTAAPWLDRLEGTLRLKGALAAVTAAVVGVVAQLALWFAGAVLLPAGQPDWRALGIAAGAALLLFVLRRRVIEVVALAALASLVLQPLIS